MILLGYIAAHIELSETSLLHRYRVACKLVTKIWFTLKPNIAHVGFLSWFTLFQILFKQYYILTLLQQKK